MVGHDRKVRLFFENLRCEHCQCSLRTDLDEDTCTSIVHGIDLRSPFNRGCHLWCKFGKNTFLSIRSFSRIERSVHIRSYWNGWPIDFKRGEETSEWFIRRSHNAGMECMACCERDAIESFLFELLHHVLNCFSGSGDNGHLR